MNQDDLVGGGPAFPEQQLVEGLIGSTLGTRQSGMSLRDYFAAKALPALMTEFMGSNSAWSDYNELAASAWAIADAMLRERAK